MSYNKDKWFKGSYNPNEGTFCITIGDVFIQVYMSDRRHILGYGVQGDADLPGGCTHTMHVWGWSMFDPVPLNRAIFEHGGGVRDNVAATRENINKAIEWAKTKLEEKKKLEKKKVRTKPYAYYDSKGHAKIMR